MGKIKAWYRSIPLWLAIFLFAAAALTVCSFVSDRVTEAAGKAVMQINLRYMVIDFDAEPAEDGMTFHTVDGEEGEVVVYRVNLDAMDTADARRYDFYRFVVRYGPIFIYSAGLFLATLLVYFTKLKKPLTLLRNASAKIAENDLGFPLDYAGRDEMAKLCGSFDKMRSALDENNSRMLRMLDERQQLNDAYTHDLRTPIAILKGYTEMLGKYLPTGEMPQEEVLETVHTMSAHVLRLEQFVNSMNAAQRIADLPLTREPVPAGEFLCGLRETASLLCGEKGLSCETDFRVDAETLHIDPTAVTQVFENLLGNAIRFASAKVSVRLECDGKTFSICVADDGKGFSGKELVTAVRPYYSGRQKAGTYHFGLGLHICRTLCEKHGGSLALANADGGASVTAVFAME